MQSSLMAACARYTRIAVALSVPYALSLTPGLPGHGNGLLIDL